MIIDDETLESVRRNASFGSNGTSRSNSTPKRPRSEYFSDPSKSESAKRLRSSLRSSTKSVAPPSEETSLINHSGDAEDDANALLKYARELKHKGEAERKGSHETVKKNPSIPSQQYDRFVENYLRASLAYLRCCAIYEKKRLIDQAREVYESTAKLAIYAAAGVTDASPVYRRALASLCLKSASIAYARRYQMDRKQSASISAQLEEAIRVKSGDVALSLDLLKRLRATNDECDNDARASCQRWNESEKIIPNELNNFEIEIPLNPDPIGFANYAKAEQQRARYLADTD
jgi:hypothetical protein